MNRLRDSTEVKEAAELLGALWRDAAAEAGGRGRGARLEQALASLCTRGGFKHAVVVDQQGLLLAAHNVRVESGAAAAFTTMAAECLERTQRLLEAPAANRLSVDLDLVDRAVTHRFVVDDLPYYLTVACGQDVEERGDVELSIEQLAALIRGRGGP
ncbi:MAG: hypothetical protein IT373_35705 [Polyangiaceae bacterium]|nr:hypothetical protein [Polyangiaceae bacterium]